MADCQPGIVPLPSTTFDLPVVVVHARPSQRPTAAPLDDPAGQKHAAGNLQVDFAPRGTVVTLEIPLEDQVGRADRWVDSHSHILSRRRIGLVTTVGIGAILVVSWC